MGGLVKSVFGSDTPKVPEPVPVPTVDDATVAREKEDAARRRKGRAAYVLTGEAGAGSPTSATKTLLGG